MLASAAAAVIFGTCCTARIGEISGANGGAAAMGALLARRPRRRFGVADKKMRWLIRTAQREGERDER